MRETIGVLELARLTGDNRKAIYRQAEKGRIPSMFKNEKVRRGNGSGFRFKPGPVLTDWIDNRRMARDASLAAAKEIIALDRDLALASNIAEAVDALERIESSMKEKLPKIIKRLKGQSAWNLQSRLFAVATAVENVARTIR
jgi:hypothetical protein